MFWKLSGAGVGRSYAVCQVGVCILGYEALGLETRKSVSTLKFLQNFGVRRKAVRERFALQGGTGVFA